MDTGVIDSFFLFFYLLSLFLNITATKGIGFYSAGILISMVA